MATRILMPKLSFIVTEGTILEWLKQPGDWVDKGEPLLVIESEKATVEVESPGTGIVGPDLAPLGTTVPITTTIGYILEPGEEPPRLELGLGEPAETLTEAVTDRVYEETSPIGQERKALEKRRVKASPSAKRLAREHSIDLFQIEGSGPQGRIVKEDILAYVEARTRHERKRPVRVTPAARRLASKLGVDLSKIEEGTGWGGRVTLEDVKKASPAMPIPSSAEGPLAEQIELTSIQRITAERMALSFRTAPHFYLSVQVDMSQAVAMRKALLPVVEAKTDIRLSFSDILVFAVARALREHLSLNAAFEEDQLKKYQDINVGLAVDTPRGLTVPIFHGADRFSLAEITRRRAEVVERARNNRLSPDDISGGTFTVSNLGMFGVDVFSAIINPPQAAILAAGQIAKRPVVVDDTLQARPTMWLTLSVDHRAADGATAARFLQDLVRHLEDPYQMPI
jgi:pyruvate dehydrogenase E2 component (dihydrolipoamide acetyltransferase)